MRPTIPHFLLCATSALLLALMASASEVVEVSPLTDRIIMVHFDDGHVVHHTRGQPRSDEEVVVAPLDVDAASRAATYSITSTDDTAYAQPRQPTDVGRKSKGTDFAWFADKFVDGRAVNERPDHAKEHWLYLTLPEPMQRGKTYTITTGNLASNGREWKLTFDERAARSEAVHVNLIGYVPAAPQKFAYVYHWMGDRGSLDLKAHEGRAFHVIDLETKQPALSGKLAFRKPADNPETHHVTDSPPHGNFLNAGVYECDLSALDKPGRYVVAVDGVGCSFPFRVDADVYREPFRTVARGLYHNRSGIALTESYTEFTRPAPHNPKLTPGFAGKLLYTTVRWADWGSEGGDPKVLRENVKGPIESCGWYQDAGDWDSYVSHLRVPQELLFAYELAPRNFTDGELNIPGSGNNVPDLLDEAAWLPRFCYRLRHELLDKNYGTGGIGLRVAGDAFGHDEKTLPDGTKVGQGSWEDVAREYVASGEDPWSTYGYAGTAAHLAHCLSLAGVADPDGVNWEKEAVEAYAWAKQNTRPGDEQNKPGSLRDQRAYAAAALFRITGDARYEAQFKADVAHVEPTTLLWDAARYGPFVYTLTAAAKPEARPDADLAQRVRAAVVATADHSAIEVPSKRALRWGGNWFMPMLIGHQTTPWILEAAVAHALVKQDDPAKARQYLAALYTTADYFLGTNALNMTWVTGLGERHPVHVFHMDAWYNGRGQFHPGIIPYGPWLKRTEFGTGPWDVAWPHKTVHPPIDAWPGNERWFDNRCSPLNSEFTVHQNTGPAAAIFGILCAPGLEAKD